MGPQPGLAGDRRLHCPGPDGAGGIIPTAADLSRLHRVGAVNRVAAAAELVAREDPSRFVPPVTLKFAQDQTHRRVVPG